MRTADFDFELPHELIAQQPAPRRDASRLLVLHRQTSRIDHRQFPDLREYLRAGDVLVLNNSRVVPARLRAAKIPARGRIEILLLEENAPNDWWAMLRPGRRCRVGTELVLQDADRIRATILDINEEGRRRLQFTGTTDIKGELERLGEVPLPPYIARPGTEKDKERYQTVFARTDGSIAAPTAGLHFTTELLERIRAEGVRVCFVTLHVGAGTFLPVTVETPEMHHMHEERFELSEETAWTINEAKSAGGRVMAVGTTTVRVLESVAAKNGGKVAKNAGKTNIFIYPPFQFHVVDALLTNFHLPCSTLLMLVSAFASPRELGGRDAALSAYAEAIRERYRFYSYGDAMLIV